jgi:glutathione S-transferase
MLEIYLAEHCPYCIKVRNVMEELQMPYLLRPVIVRSETPIALELKERAGKAQVPYMIDPERDVEMYESDDIIAYVRKL